MNAASTRPDSARWLNRRRLRAHGLLLAVGLWAVYAVNMSTAGLRDRGGLIKGTDFLHFYTLGKLALAGRGDLLYDMQAQSTLLGQWVAAAAGSVYVPLYGPQVAMFFELFARLSYGWALTAWLLLNGLIYAGCCFAVYRTCPNLRSEMGTVAVLAIAFPGLFHLIAWGQTSGLALGFLTLAYLALRRRRSLLAGAAIGCLIFKPQLGLAAAVVFVLGAEWKVVVGAVLSAALQLALAWMRFGSAVMQNYARALWHVREVMRLLEPRPYQMHSLRAFWSLLLPWPQVAFGLYLLSAAAVLGLLVSCWWREPALELRFSALLFATVLVSPHLTVYDLVILAPAFLLLGDYAAGAVDSGKLGSLLYACYPLFLLGPLARYTHVQLSVAAMAAVLAVIVWRRFPTPPYSKNP